MCFPAAKRLRRRKCNVCFCNTCQPLSLNFSGCEIQPFVAVVKLFFLFLQIEETGRGKESSTMVVATTLRGAATGTTNMSSTGTRTTIMGTGDTWTPTVPGAIDPTACPERDLMTSTAVTETTGDTEITMTGGRKVLRHQALISARSFTLGGAETSDTRIHVFIKCSLNVSLCARHGP